MGHTDVVPVNPDGWSRDPFGGELVDGEVWGRGAIDMLNITSSMAVAFRQLADEGFRPQGTLIYFGVADEEAGGHWGAEYMVDAPLGRRRRRLRAHRDRRLVDDRPRRHPPHHGQRRREGDRLAPPARRTARPATARCRSAPTTPWSRRPRSCAAWRRIRPAPQLDDLWRARVDGDGPARRPAGRARRPGPHRRRDRLARRRATPASPTPARTRRSRPTSSTAGRRRTRSPTSSTSTSTSAPCPATPREVVDGYLAEALGDLADRGRDLAAPGVRADPLGHRQPAVGRARGAHAGRLPRRRPAARHHRRRHRRPLLPRAGGRSPTAPRCSRRR